MRDLRASHFTDPAHQALYLAITGHDSAGMASRLRSRLALLTSGRARRAAAYAGELRGLCPESGHRWVYAAMLLEASRQPGPDAPAAGPQRQADADQRLAGADEWLAASGAGSRRPGRALQQNAPIDRRTRQLARTLRPVVHALLLESPVDPLITAWQANKREPGPAWQPDTDGTGRESLTALALRLGEMATVRGTAAVIARVLLADHECTTAFGPGWTSRPLTWGVAAEPAVGD